MTNNSNNAIEQRQIRIVGIVTALTLFGDSMLYIVLPVYWKEAGLDALWQVGVLLSVNRLVRSPLILSLAGCIIACRFEPVCSSLFC